MGLLAGHGTSSRFHAASGAAIFPGAGRRRAGQEGAPTRARPCWQDEGGSRAGPNHLGGGRAAPSGSTSGPQARGGGAERRRRVRSPRGLQCLGAGTPHPRAAGRKPPGSPPSLPPGGADAGGTAGRERESPAQRPGQAAWPGRCPGLGEGRGAAVSPPAVWGVLAVGTHSIIW